MKNIVRISGVILLIILIHSCKKDDVTNIFKTISDNDGNVYTAVTIGTQTWMKENLKTTKYNDGTAIPLVTGTAAWVALSTPGYCWYNNDAATYKATYGAMYNWYTVNTGKLCPTGWHIPTDVEWTTLINYLGGPSIAGGKLKEAGTTHWQSPNTGATNESGFTALPGGVRTSFEGELAGLFPYLGNMGWWWSSSEMFFTNYGILGGGISLSKHNAAVSNAEISWLNAIGYTDKGEGYSVRCVKDN